MSFTAADVKTLREMTSVGMMDCKKALTECDGDMDKAVEYLREKGLAKAAKKAGRIAAEGIVVVRVSDDQSFGLIGEVNSETDFAARDAGFQGFANKVVDQAFATRTTDVAAVMAGSLDAEREALVQKIGENISLRRLATLSGSLVSAYVHAGSRIAVLVALKGGNAELAKDVAMHIAAVNPQFVSPADVSQEVITKESEIIKAQPDMAGKPEQIVEKMIGGRIKKFLSEISLSEQAFVKNPEITVGKLVSSAGATVTGFIRFEVGEGIVKEEKDFAAEVAEQLAKV